MPCRLDWEQNGVCAKFSGICTVADVLHAFEQIGGDVRADDILFAIFDFLDVESQNVTESETEEVAAIDNALALSFPRLRFASVTTDPRILELWRHFISVHPMPERHGVFPSVAEARAWPADNDANPGSYPSRHRR